MTEHRVRAGYDAVAATYAEQFCDELDHKPLERGLLGAFCGITPHGMIADIGCGPGHITSFLAARRDNVVGLDLSPAMISVAQQRNPGLGFAVASMLNLPCPDEAFTGVVAMYSIIHLDAAERVLAFGEFARTLCRDGRLLLSFHVDMDGYFLDPAAVTSDLIANGFRVEARMDREPIADIEFSSRRCYILARRAVPSTHGPRA